MYKYHGSPREYLHDPVFLMQERKNIKQLIEYIDFVKPMIIAGAN